MGSSGINTAITEVGRMKHAESTVIGTMAADGTKKEKSSLGKMDPTEMPKEKSQTGTMERNVLKAESMNTGAITVNVTTMELWSAVTKNTRAVQLILRHHHAPMKKEKTKTK